MLKTYLDQIFSVVFTSGVLAKLLNAWMTLKCIKNNFFGMGLSALGVRGIKGLGDAVTAVCFFVEEKNVVLIEMTAELLG